MRIKELNSEEAKTEAVMEYVNIIGYSELMGHIRNGEDIEELIEDFDCALSLNGIVSPPGDVYYLGDEIFKVMDGWDVENLPWLMTLVENGMVYAVERGWAFKSIDQLAFVLESCDVAFDEDGDIVLMG